MTLIFPFKGIRYNRNLNPLDNLIVPPFDEISEQKRKYYSSIPYNFVHFTLPEDYSIPKKLVEEYLKNSIFMEDIESYYLMEIDYGKGILNGIIAAVDLNGNIFPHEKTFDLPVNDRFNLLFYSGFDFEPVYFLTNFPLNFEKMDLLSYGMMNSINYKLYNIKLKNNDLGNLVIADGHHRFRAALHFHWKTKNHDKILGFIVNINDKNLILNKANKLVNKNLINLNKLRENFDFSDHGLKFIIDNNIYYIIPKNEEIKKLPQIFWFVYMLNDLNIEYNINNVKTIFDDFCDNNYACFYPDPPKPSEVFDLALKNILFPQKSTYFLPKPASGLVFMKK